MYAEFVREVDPRGYILDFLYQSGVVSNEIVQQLRRRDTTQDCCRSLLYELFSRGNPRAYIELRTALEQGYRHIVNKINATTTGTFVYTVLAKES